MGCASSKSNLPSEPTPVREHKQDTHLKQPEHCDDFTECDVDSEAVSEEPEPEPEPEPPAAPVACRKWRIDPAAEPCMSCPPGWLVRTAFEGKKAGEKYYFSATGISQWESPPGEAKSEAEPTCITCGCLEVAHAVCDEYAPPEGETTCTCGFGKERHKPCGAYRVNVAAATFGDCKCGFAKDLHAAAAFASGAKRSLEKKTSKELRGEMVQKCFAACPEYRVNLQSSNFGECMCGRPKAEHSPEALKKNAIAGQTAGTTRRDAVEVRNQFVQKQKVECMMYEPNLTSGEFGVCVCGAKRADHTDLALAAGTGAKAAKQQDAADVRAGFVQRSVAECARFELNMDPAAPFGTCVCGRPRAEHAESALAARRDSAPKTLMKKTSSMVREEMAAKQEQIGAAVETVGAKTGVAYGLGNTVRTAAEEQATIQAAINARAGGADKAAALNDFNTMMKEAAAPAAV